MSKIKTIAMLLSLVLLTAVVIFTPFIFSEQSEDKILNKTIYQNCTITNKVNISSKDVALLFHNHEIIINAYDFMYKVVDDKEKAKIVNNTSEVFETVFNKNDQFFSHLKDLLNINDSLFTTRYNVLAHVDNQPVGLSFIEVIVESKNELVEVIFEEKTKTVISFLYQNLDGAIRVDSEADLENSNLSIRNYYETKVNVSSKYYYIFCDELKSEESSIGIYLNFGILQTEEIHDFTYAVPKETT